MIFNNDTWAGVCKGYSIYDCALRSRDRQAFLMVERVASPHRDTLPQTRFVFTYAEAEDPEERFYWESHPHFTFARIAGREAPAPAYAAVDLRGNVFGYDATAQDLEARHPRALQGTELLNVIQNIVRVEDTLFTVGGPRRVYRRTARDTWEDLTSTVPIPRDFIDEKPNLADYYWADLSGFSKTDMYAVGGAGEVWHFDGRIWDRKWFPSNERLNNVCCAGDGNVYVAASSGVLYMGRGDRWRLLSAKPFSMPFKDIAWFAGQLWCGSDYGLWVLQNDALVRAKIPADVQLVSGAIDISPDGSLMLTAGPEGAALFDGKTWDILFSRFDLEREAVAQ